MEESAKIYSIWDHPLFYFLIIQRKVLISSNSPVLTVDYVTDMEIYKTKNFVKSQDRKITHTYNYLYAFFTCEVKY